MKILILTLSTFCLCQSPDIDNCREGKETPEGIMTGVLKYNGRLKSFTYLSFKLGM